MRIRAWPGGRAGDALARAGYWLVVVLLFGAIGAAAGRLVLPDETLSNEPPGPLVVGAAAVDPSAPARAEARRIAQEFGQGEVKLVSGDFERSLPRERLGLRVDQAEVARLIAAWRDPASPLRRYREAAAVRGPAAVPVPATLDFEVASRTLLGLKEDFDVEAADAHIDLEKGTVVPERAGRRLDLYATAAELQRAARAAADRVELAVVAFEPRVREKELRAIDFHDRLGWFKTPYSQMVKDRHRTYNLALAAKALDGQVVMPGEVFSFNEVVGERSEARGYRVAHVIAAGQLVDGMGGGTCQIAGTLHAAAFFAGLDIVKREPHSRPSTYIRVGLDATVSYPNIDLQLRNPFPYPVVLGMRVADGWVTGEVRGPRRELTITYVRTLLETKAPPTRTIPDETMPRGLEVVEQRGVPGYTVRRWRIFRKGTVQWRNSSTDRYPPTPHIVKVGTNPALERPETAPELPAPVGDACNMKIVQGPNDLFDEQTNCGESGGLGATPP